MRKPIIFDPLAEDEVTTAYLWYSSRSVKAGPRFLQALDLAVEQIGDRPESFPAYIAGTRKCILHKFPYLVVYRVDAEIVYVVAVAHGHQNPGYWRKRI